MKRRLLATAVALLAAATCVGCSAFRPAGPSWPRWRGANGDGVSAETRWNPAALAQGPKILWHMVVAMGYGGVVLEGGRLYTLDSKGTACLDAETGKEIWRAATGKGDGDSTPAIDGRWLYVLNKSGVLHCLRARDGKLRWTKDLRSDYDVEAPPYGFATSPVVEGGLVVLNVNTSGIALDKTTGAKIWASPRHPRGQKLPSPDGHYSTPVVIDTKGGRCALLLSSAGLYCVEVRTGKRAWFQDWRMQHNAPDPVLVGDRVFVASAGAGGGRCALLDSSAALPAVIWENDTLASSITTSVRAGGFLYGGTGEPSELTIATSPFRCVDAATGKVLWERQMLQASVTVVGSKLIILDESGMLRVAEATPSAYVEISSCQLPSAKRAGLLKPPHRWWTPPVFVGGRIYCRNYWGDLVCVDVRS